MEVATAVPRNTIPRPRIVERLRTAATYPVTLVIAPAGYGKTTAIRNLLAESTLPSIYVVTPLGATFEYFIQAFARACSELFPGMATPPSDPDLESQDAESRIELYAAWAAVHLQTSNCTIAVDDLQYADHDRSIGEYLARLTDSTKSNIKWIFSSRTRGNLPVVRWQTYGDADVATTAVDLRMSLDEAVAYGAHLNCPATIEQMGTWLTLTQGFPVPLTFAIRLSARRHSVDEIMDGTRAVTFQFLAEQLWGSLPKDAQHLLEVAAFAPSIQIHAYEKSGLAHSSAIISLLCDEIAFLDLTPAGFFSMHDLFRDFIKQLLSQAGSATQRDRLNTAVEMLLSSGYHNEGFALLVESADNEYIAKTIERYPSADCDLTTTRRLVDATEALNPKHLGLRTLELQAEHWSWMGKAHRSFRCAQEIFCRTEASSAQILCAIRAIFRMANFQDTEELERWAHLLPQHFELLNEPDLIQATAYQASLLTRSRHGSLEAASLVRQVQSRLDLLEPTARVDAFLCLASALFYLKDNEGCLSATHEAATLASASGNARETARALNYRGLMLLHLYDPEVEKIFEPLRDAVERTGSWRFSQVSHWWPASYYALQGNLLAASGARRRQSAVMASEDSQKPILISVRRHSTNLCNLLREEYRLVIEDFVRNGTPKKLDSSYELISDVAIAYAFSSALRECEEILVRLRRLRLSLSSIELRGVRIPIFIEVIALCLVGQWAAARRLNEQHSGELPTLAPLENACALFCQGPPFIGVTKALEACHDRAYMGLPALIIQRVLDRELTDQPARILTKAEDDVLHLLEIGKSNKEIATTRSRSAETVKRQIASIYRKLGVENRTSAVAAARERGLL